jgi:hypothetical protein
MTTYKVFFHAGDDLGIKTKVDRGTATLDDSILSLDGPNGLRIALRDIHAVKLFRLHGLGRVIQIDHAAGRLFVSAIRFMIGQFATINFFKTGELNERLIAATTRPTDNQELTTNN